MKPARFDYAAPRHLEDALRLLAEGGEDSRPLAGGQSLVPAMNFRLARPSLLVDLGRIAALRGLGVAEDGSMIAGAMTRHRDFEFDASVRERLPLLRAAMPGIAHPAIRSRGTIGGSLAHADPSADWPALCMACDAEITVTSATGKRKLPAADWVLDVFHTALAPGEIVAEVRFPAWPKGRRWGLQKRTRRHGDFALAGVVCTLGLEEGKLSAVRLVVYGAASRPLFASAAMAFLSGKTPSDDVFRQASALAAQEIPVRGDLHASAEFRTELVGTLARRALAEACHG